VAIALTMEEASISETSENFYYTTRRNIRTKSSHEQMLTKTKRMIRNESYCSRHASAIQFFAEIKSKAEYGMRNERFSVQTDAWKD
jgi:hypothetical protein